jgi:hypothetical protein
METEVNKRLEEIAKEIQGGARPRDFQLEIDVLLGTEMAERSVEAEAAYENQRELNND